MGKRNSISNPYFFAPLLILTVSAFLTVMKFSSVSGQIGGGLESNAVVYAVLTAIQLLVFGIPCLIFCVTHKDGYIKSLPISHIKEKDIAITVTGCLTLIFQSCVFKFGVFYFGYEYSAYKLYGSSFSNGNENIPTSLLMIAALCILPALTEEFVFRGILIREYSKSGALVTVLVTSLLFAMIHFDFTNFILHFLSGALLGWTVLLTGSAVTAFIIHLCYNLYVMFIEKYVWLLFCSPDSEVLFSLIFISLYLLSLFLFLTFAEKIQRRKTDGESGYKTDKAIYFYDNGSKGERITGESVTYEKKSFFENVKDVVLTVPFILVILLFLTVTIISSFT